MTSVESVLLSGIFYVITYNEAYHSVYNESWKMKWLFRLVGLVCFLYIDYRIVMGGGYCRMLLLVEINTEIYTCKGWTLNVSL